MPFSVFISYSHTDRETADKVCAALEARGFGCWIAPRDVLPGADWGASIIDAINDARVMVLVYSAASNHSHQVRREVERAVAKGVSIIPFRVEPVPLGKTLEYFLATAHWMDAFPPPLEAHVTRLADAVRTYLDAPRDTTGPIQARKDLSPPLLPVKPAAAPPEAPGPAKDARRLPRPALVVGLALAAALVYLFAFGGGPEIVAIDFPATIAAGTQPVAGSLRFKAGNSDIVGARFAVIEASSFSPFDVRAAAAGQKEGRLNFGVFSAIPQRVTLEARLVDAAGRQSRPHRFSFEARKGAGHFQIDTPHFKVKVP
jgi:hypothetical protein